MEMVAWVCRFELGGGALSRIAQKYQQRVLEMGAGSVCGGGVSVRGAPESFNDAVIG